MVDGATTQFQWRAHPARERPGQAALGLALILAVAGSMLLGFRHGALAVSLGESVALAIASAIVLLATQNRFFLPSSFAVDDEGITARYPLRSQRMKWSDLRRFVHDQNGGYLSTRGVRSRLDAYTGMHILFGTQRTVVIDNIRAHMQAAKPAISQGTAWAG